MSRCSPLSNQALAGIIKRQPYSLDLSWTPLAKRQLNCLLTRLPGTDARQQGTFKLTPVACCVSQTRLASVLRSEGAQSRGFGLVLSVGSGLADPPLSAASGPALVRRH